MAVELKISGMEIQMRYTYNNRPEEEVGKFREEDSHCASSDSDKPIRKHRSRRDSNNEDNCKRHQKV